MYAEYHSRAQIGERYTSNTIFHKKRKRRIDMSEGKNTGALIRKVYIIENLDCANCAAAVERRLNSLPEISEAVLTFATKQLRITAEDPDAILDKIRREASAVEPGVEIYPRTRAGRKCVQTPDCGHSEKGHASSCHESCCSHKHHHEEEKSDCSCGHKHHHEEESDCGCGHKHHHEEEESGRGCGHGHHHEEEREDCGCGHEHNHGNKTACLSAVKKVYTIEGLDCANCAAAVERKISGMPEVHEAVLTFATKQLRITAENPDALLDRIRAAACSVEPEVTIEPRTGNAERKSGAVSDRQDREGSGISVTGKKILGFSRENRKDFLQILAGAVLFAGGIVLNVAEMEIPSAVVLLAGYLILGGRIILDALKNLIRGKAFDENFLMSLATIAAICIGDFKEAVGVMLFYRVGELFEEIAVERSRSQIMDAVDMRPEVVTKVHGSHTHVIPAEEAAAGDILLIRPGDRIPLDGTVVEGESRIDTSPVTGEPVPAAAKAGDPVVSGCINTSGVLKIRVDKVLEESMVTKILDSVENAAASKPQIERFIARFARVYTPFVVILAALTAVVPSLATGDWNHWLYTAITFLVISCPCALVLSVPLAFFSGIGAGSKRGILFKGGVSLEAMKRIRAVVMDKTGTITQGNFRLQEAVAADGTEPEKLLSLCASCEQSSTHPIAQSILAAAAERGISYEIPSHVEEIAGHGIRAVLPEGEVLCGNRKLMEKFQVRVDEADAGYGTEVFAALNGRFIGYLMIADTVKAEAAEAVAALKSRGIVTAMLTGDASENAEAVAKATGIDEVHARLLPQEKLEVLQKIRAERGAVMFVGDGINDAPVLAGADVGAAMGTGADAAIEAADVVFMTSQLDAVPKALRIAWSSIRIARQNVVFALVIKALVMILGLAGFANMWMAVFADTGVAMICVLNSIRVLYRKDF